MNLYRILKEVWMLSILTIYCDKKVSNLVTEGAQRRNPSFLSWRDWPGLLRETIVRLKMWVELKIVPHYSHEFLPISSKGKVSRIWHIFPILCPSDESLSLDVFVYLVVANVYAYLLGLASSLQLMISSWSSLWRKKKSLWKWPTSQRISRLTIPPEVFIKQNWYTGVPQTF